jgi:hypothetical protein
MQPVFIENQKRKAPSQDQNYWRELINKFEKSGEHPKDFCARMDIKLGTLSHWRYFFRKEKKSKENKFVEIKVTPKEKLLEQFSIECPTGHKIIFSQSLKMDEAQVILKLLGLVS